MIFVFNKYFCALFALFYVLLVQCSDHDNAYEFCDLRYTNAASESPNVENDFKCDALLHDSFLSHAGLEPLTAHGVLPQIVGVGDDSGSKSPNAEFSPPSTPGVPFDNEAWISSDSPGDVFENLFGLPFITLKQQSCVKADAKNLHSQFSDGSTKDSDEEASGNNGDDSFGGRVHSLLERLNRGKVCFEDVKKSLYPKSNVLVFQEDILRLMRDNIDICRSGKGFMCTGKVRSKDFCPLLHVSEAMFMILCDETMTLFDMKFELYSKGYVHYAREFLLCLEMALIVGDVHPHSREIRAKGNVHMNAKLKAIWQKVQGFISSELTDFLSRKHDRGHEDYLGSFYKRVIKILWDLKDTKLLRRLEELKAELDASRQPLTALSPLHVSRKAQVLAVVQRYKNQEFTIPDIITLLDIPISAGCRRVFLQSALLLALDGFPIIYHKYSQSIMFLDPAADVSVPPEGTNFLTMLYDLSEEYQTQLLPEEIAYYAHKGGYLEQDANGKVTNRAKLFERIDACQEALAVQEYIDVAHCAVKNQNKIRRHKMLWPTILKEDTEYTLTYYRRIFYLATQKDLNDLRELKKRIKEEDFIVLRNHVSCSTVERMTITGADFVQSCLCRRDYTFSDLLSLCQRRGMHVKDLWDAAGALTCREEGGRLLYFPDEERFVWDSKSRMPTPLECSFVARCFTLQSMYPNATHAAIAHMLKQEGFCNTLPTRVKQTMRGLETLGLNPCLVYAPFGHFYKQRQFLNLMLTENATIVPDRGASGSVSWQWKTAQMVLSWQKDKTMELLLQAYIKRQGYEQKDASDQDGVIPPVKRQKMEEGLQTFGCIIRDEIPELYSLLCKKGLWPSVK